MGSGSATDIVLFLNGKKAKTSGHDPLDPLVVYIRDTANLKGTKSNCSYGCTGACTVLMSSWDKKTESFTHRTISSCSTPLASCHWTNITTVEGIGNADSPHPLQQRLADCHGVQCGYDAPGIVVSMFGLLLNRKQPLLGEVERTLVGNLSRCNGYRAVLEAYKQFAEAPNNELSRFEKSLPNLAHEILEPAVIGGAWYILPSLIWLKTLQAKHPDFVVVYGIPSVKEINGSKTIFDLSKVDGSKKSSGRKGVEISANTTITQLITTLKGVTSKNNAGVMNELISALENTKTSQYRNARAVGDALNDCKELRLLLLTLNASLAINPLADCKLMKIMGIDKIVSVKDALNEMKKVSVKSIIIPEVQEEQVLLFYRVSSRKSNGSNMTCAVFLTSTEKQTVSNMNAYYGTSEFTETCISKMADILSRVKIGALEGIKGDLTGLTGHNITDGLILKFVNDLKVYSGLHSDERQTFFTQRNEGRKAIQSTQYKEHVAGDFADTLSPLGRPVPSRQSLNCATGQAVFMDDKPKSATELFFAPVLSTVAHGKIKNIMLEKALQIDGVERFVSAADVPAGKNKFKIVGFEDEKVFAEDTVDYVGDLIGGIVAENEKIARLAASLVEVEYEMLPSVVSLEEAIAKKNFLSIPEEEVPTFFKKGDAEEALSNAEHVISGSIQTTRQEHFYEEVNCVLVVPTGENNEYNIYSPTANQLSTQHTVASTLNIPFNRINIFTDRVGCSYGGKVCRFIPYVAAVALASKLVKRPVRSVLTRDEDIKVTGQRGEFKGEYSAGVSGGKLTGVKYHLYKNAGWNSDGSPDIVTTTMLHLDSVYESPAFLSTSNVCLTNTPSNTAFRGYGAPPACAISENMIFDICAELNFDPVEFRRNNFQKGGYTTFYGYEMTDSDVTMNLCFEEVINSSKFYDMKKEVEEFNAANKERKRGIALIPNNFGIGLPSMFSQGGCLINISLDGSVSVAVGGIELGQGLFTKLVQIVSQELGIPMTKIHMSETSTKAIPNPILTGGSTAADLSGNALRVACKEINQKLAPFREAQPKAPWEMLVGMAFGSKINLSTTGFYSVPSEKFSFDTKTKQGRRFWYYTGGAAFSMVEVDLLTGQHTLLKTDIVMDVGESINSAIDIANIEAAFIQGYGYLVMESCQYDQQGRLVSRGHDEYDIPTIADCPAEFNVTLLRGNKKEEHVLYSSKGIGEPPFFAGESVYFAIKDALLRLWRSRGGKGTINLKTPATPENILNLVESFKA